MDLNTLREIDKRHAKRIAEYLLKQIEIDDLLKTKLLETEKTLQQCVEYVKSQAAKQAEDNMAWISDDEVYGWVVDFYLDDSIEVKATSSTPEKKTNESYAQYAKRVQEHVHTPKDTPVEKKPTKKSATEEIQKKLYGEMDLFSL